MVNENTFATMMKHTIAIALWFVCITASTAQTQRSATQFTINIQELERCIELAKQNYPQRKIAALTERKAKSAIEAESLGYLDMFNMAYFYRPDDRRAINIENPYVFNGFQFGVNVNLGSMLQRPAKVRQARVDYEVAKQQSKAYDDILVTEVKKRYYEYRRAKEDLSVKTQALEDYRVLAEALQLRFEQGEIELTDYATAKTAASNAQSELLQAQMALLTAQDALEEIIGTSISEIN